MVVEITRLEDLCCANKEVYSAVNGPIKQVVTPNDDQLSSKFDFEICFKEIDQDKIQAIVDAHFRLMTTPPIDDYGFRHYALKEEQLLYEALQKHVQKQSPVYTNSFAPKTIEWELHSYLEK